MLTCAELIAKLEFQSHVDMICFFLMSALFVITNLHWHFAYRRLQEEHKPSDVIISCPEVALSIK